MIKNISHHQSNNNLENDDENIFLLDFNEESLNLDEEWTITANRYLGKTLQRKKQINNLETRQFRTYLNDDDIIINEKFIENKKQLIWQTTIFYKDNQILKKWIYIENGQIKEIEQTNNFYNLTTIFTLLKNWWKPIVSSTMHISSTAIFMIKNILPITPASILSRAIGAILPSWVIPKLSQCAENKPAKLGVKIVELSAITSTIIETICFNFFRLNEEEQTQFSTNPLANLHLIFCNKIFFNEIAIYFTAEQLIAIITTVLKIINIWVKCDNKLTNLINNTQTLVRMLLISMAFAMISYQITTGQIAPDSPYLSFFGAQLACGGAYIVLSDALKNIYKLITNQRNTINLSLENQLQLLSYYTNQERNLDLNPNQLQEELNTESEEQSLLTNPSINYQAINNSYDSYELPSTSNNSQILKL